MKYIIRGYYFFQTAFLTILISILFGCTSDNKKPLNNVLDKFEKELYSHFPNQSLFNHYDVYLITDPIFDRITTQLAHVYLTVEPKNYESELNKLKSKSIAIRKFNDPCNLIPMFYQENMSFESQLGMQHQYQKRKKYQTSYCDSSNYVAIPNFIGMGSEKINGVSNYVDIIVLESKKGKYFDNRFYGPEMILPVGWEHGYSKGAVIHPEQRKIIYWFVVW